MQKWLKEKPIRFAILIGVLNMETVVIPFILKGLLCLSGWPLKSAATLWASAEIVFWYWFAGWAIERIKESKPVREAVAISKENMPEIKDKKSGIRNIDLVKKMEEWVNEYIIEPFNPENQKARNLFLFIKGCGYIFGLPVMFIFGLVPGFWIPALIFCRAISSKTGFAAIVLGNIVKNIFFAESWDFIWKFF